MPGANETFRGPAAALRMACLALAMATGTQHMPAQESGIPPSLGPHHFVIVDLIGPGEQDYGEFRLRGLTGTLGIAHDGVFLRAGVRYREWILKPSSLEIAWADFEVPIGMTRFEFPDFHFRPYDLNDTDGDGLHDLGEFIVGTNPDVADTDDDGVSDGAEVRAGTNPLDGLPAANGLLSAADTPGRAQDVAAANGVAAVADGASGVILFDVRDPLNPVRIAQVDTPGDGASVAIGNNLLAVTDGGAGLAVIDISDPPAAAILHQIPFGSPARSVALDDTLGYVGLDNGAVALVDLPGGFVLQRKQLDTQPVQDVVLGREVLYALVSGRLYTIALQNGTLGAATFVTVTSLYGQGGQRGRLVFAHDRLWLNHRSGVDLYSLADPLQPALVRQNANTQLGWKRIVPNGSGLGIGAIGTNITDDGPHDVDVYVIAPDGTATFQETHATPGVALGVAIYNGLAYVADAAAGLEVLNYLAFDTGSEAPTIALEASFSLEPADTAAADEGRLARVSALVTDDVQVATVEFLIDGNRVAIDGGFPFELRFTTPLRTAQKTSFTVQARAFDTGGNVTASPVYTIALTPDTTAPVLVSTNPANASMLGTIDTLLLGFNELVDLTTIDSTSAELRHLGADRTVGTSDDTVIAPAIVSSRDTTFTAVLAFATPLPGGVYRLTVGPPLADLAGNPLGANTAVTFTLFDQADRDRDGVPDELEVALGLNPDNPDSDGDGIPDGLEDVDGDGLSNAGEVLLGTNASVADTDGNGINDGNEDADTDGLANKLEVLAGTLPLVADTDGDGWNDETEVTFGSDPLSSASRPTPFVLAPASAIASRTAPPVTPGAAQEGVFLAQPPTSVEIQP